MDLQLAGSAGGWAWGARLSAALGALTEGVIAEDEGGHRLDHGDGARQDAGVVAAAGGEFGVLARRW